MSLTTQKPAQPNLVTPLMSGIMNDAFLIELTAGNVRNTRKGGWGQYGQ